MSLALRREGVEQRSREGKKAGNEVFFLGSSSKIKGDGEGGGTDAHVSLNNGFEADEACANGVKYAPSHLPLPPEPLTLQPRGLSDLYGFQLPACKQFWAGIWLFLPETHTYCILGPARSVLSSGNLLHRNQIRKVKWSCMGRTLLLRCSQQKPCSVLTLHEYSSQAKGEYTSG